MTIAKYKFNELAIREAAQKDGVTHFSTGIAVLRNDKILIVQRAEHDYLGGNYELPGGGVEKNETISSGAQRELLEETGLGITEILDIHEAFDYKTDKKPRVRQFNLLVMARGNQIKLDPKEHSAYKWVGQDEYQILAMSDEIKASMVRLFKNT